MLVFNSFFISYNPNFMVILPGMGQITGVQHQKGIIYDTKSEARSKSRNTQNEKEGSVMNTYNEEDFALCAEGLCEPRHELICPVLSIWVSTGSGLTYFPIHFSDSADIVLDLCACRHLFRITWQHKFAKSQLRVFAYPLITVFYGN